MLKPESTLLLVIDVQGKLAEIVDRSESTRANVVRLIRGADLLEVPVLATEQVPDKLGPTVAEVAAALGDRPRPAKVTFSCLGDLAIRESVGAARRHQVLVAGIEAHVCVFQTVYDLLSAGYDVHVAKDAVSSRAAENREIACARMAADGAVITSTEMALFELQGDCLGDRFRAISKLVR